MTTDQWPDALWFLARGTEVPHTFIAGEESAVVSRVKGGAALPRDTPELIVHKGLGGAPTLVSNVETLAHVALLARHGAVWFRQHGTREEPGTFLATLSGAVAAPGVYEAPYGISLGHPPRCRRWGHRVTAGRSRGRLPRSLDTSRDLPIARADLRKYGASPGAGVLIALPVSACGLAEGAHIVGYPADQSAGQCAPCINGLPRMADTLTRLARGDRTPGLAAEVDRLAVSSAVAARATTPTGPFASSAAACACSPTRSSLTWPGGAAPRQVWPEGATMDSKQVARLHIDWTACDGRGLCTELLPELLDRDEGGYPMPRDAGPHLVVRSDLPPRPPCRGPVSPPGRRAAAHR